MCACAWRVINNKRLLTLTSFHASSTISPPLIVMPPSPTTTRPLDIPRYEPSSHKSTKHKQTTITLRIALRIRISASFLICSLVLLCHKLCCIPLNHQPWKPVTVPSNPAGFGIISSPMAKWDLPCGGMIRRPARSHPRCRPSLWHAFFTRRASSVFCVTFTRAPTCARVHASVCLSRVSLCVRGTLIDAEGVADSHAQSRVAGMFPSLPLAQALGLFVSSTETTTSTRTRTRTSTTKATVTTMVRRQRRRANPSWSTDDLPLLTGGHPDRSPTTLAQALDTFNQIPHARDYVNVKSPYGYDHITRLSRYAAVLPWNISLEYISSKWNALNNAPKEIVGVTRGWESRERVVRC